MRYFAKYITYNEYVQVYEDPESGLNKVRNQMVANGSLSKEARDKDKPLSESEFNTAYPGGDGCLFKYYEGSEANDSDMKEISKDRAKKIATILVEQGGVSKEGFHALKD